VCSNPLAAGRVLSDASPARFSRHRRSDSNQRHLAIDLSITLSGNATGTGYSILSDARGQLICLSRDLEISQRRENRISLRPSATRPLLGFTLSADP
jgi:hypothetical protein